MLQSLNLRMPQESFKRQQLVDDNITKLEIDILFYRNTV